jgi:hypothetical protein
MPETPSSMEDSALSMRSFVVGGAGGNGVTSVEYLDFIGSSRRIHSRQQKVAIYSECKAVVERKSGGTARLPLIFLDHGS